MCAMFSFYDSPKIPDPTWAAGERTLRPWIGWITYLRPDLASRAKYPADVEVETLDDGGALVTLCEDQFAETDVPGMARLRALEAALRPIQFRAFAFPPERRKPQRQLHRATILH